MMDHEIIQAAIEKLNLQTSLGAEYKAFKKECTEGELALPNVKSNLIIKCKKHLNITTLQKYIAELKIKNQITNALLITEYINPNQAALLKEQNTSFIDRVGNTYINCSPIYIDIQGNKPEKAHNEIALAKQLGKAFQPKGMKVVFMFLVQPELVNKPMRTIAKMAEVALGTVKQVIDDLIYQEFIVQKDQHTKTINNSKALLEKWLNAYPVTVEAKLKKEIFTTDNTELLQKLELNNVNAIWGGEYAVQQYDDYLNTKNYLIYVSPEHKKVILKTARLRKVKAEDNINDAVTKVVLVEPFLAIEKLVGSKTHLAHPYLIYANLLASRDTRNIDAATRFYEKHIA
ncbi:type IV toxin-antitoxin system AbiEi family antitoxin [Pseudoalteromonas sp. SIMBA_148]